MTPVFIYFSYFIKSNEDISDWKQNFFCFFKRVNNHDHELNALFWGGLVTHLFSLSGFFGMFGTFGRSSKQTGLPAKKTPEVPDLRSLDLIGDLIGHSGAVQVRFEMFSASAIVVLDESVGFSL